MKNVLVRFGQDPSRDYKTVKVIEAQLFPDNMRTDTVSREGLVGLSNGVTINRNAGLPEDKRLDLLDKTKNASVGEAFRRILAITSGPDLDTGTYATHRQQDRLLSDIVNLLFEPQSIKEVETRTAEQTQHTGSQAVSAFIRARQRPARQISSQNISRPGYGNIS